GEVGSIREVENTEKETHQHMPITLRPNAVKVDQRPTDKQRATAENKRPAEQTQSARRKKPRRMQRATVKHNPDQRQPGQIDPGIDDRTSAGRFFQFN